MTSARPAGSPPDERPAGAGLLTASLVLAQAAALLVFGADLLLRPVAEDAAPLGGAGVLAGLGVALAVAGPAALAQAPLLAFLARFRRGAAGGLSGLPAAMAGLGALAVLGVVFLPRAFDAEPAELRPAVAQAVLVGAGGVALVVGLLVAVAAARLRRASSRAVSAAQIPRRPEDRAPRDGARRQEASRIGRRRTRGTSRTDSAPADAANGPVSQANPGAGGESGAGPALAIASAVLVLGVVGGVWWVFARALPAALLPVGASAYGALVLAILLVDAALGGRIGARVRRLSARRAARLVLWTLPAAGLVAAHVSATTAPEGTRALFARGGVAGQLVGRLRLATDGDGDGFSAWLAGGDCDDADEGRHPFARDIPGNGVDEDCQGGDRPVVAAPPSPYARAPVPPPQPLNVLFVCIEALRGDHVHFGGYPRETTPHLDALAADGLWFDEAIAASSATRESLPAVLAGRYPSEIEWVREGNIFPIAPGQPLLTDHLKESGYSTGAVVAPWIPANLPSLARSFERFVVPLGPDVFERAGQDTTGLTALAAVHLLATRDRARPFFAFVHFDAPHHPYVGHDGLPDLGETGVDLYDEEVRQADRGLGMLLAYLAEEGLLDETIIAVFGDHGEEFGEHGGAYHAWTVHHESVHVGLAVRIPGVPPARVASRVSLVDLFPTVLDATGLRPPNARPLGTSLLRSLATPDAVRDRAIVAELMIYAGGPLAFRRAIYLGPHKLIWDVAGGTQRLYDRRVDPGEHHPLDEPERAAELLRRLRDVDLR